MQRFKDKIVVITGAGSGIGRSTALRLDAEGATSIIVDINAEQLEETFGMIANKQSTQRVLDISDLESSISFFEEIQKSHKKLDALINIAGILRFDNSHEVQIEDWNKILNINLTGTFFMCSNALPMLLESKGAIVNVSSTAALGAHAWTAAYSASKAAVIGLTKSLGKELANFPITVNCVTPAAVKTDIFNQMSQEHINYMLSKIPMGRFGDPEEISSLVCWLASSECSFTTGGVFDVSGGRATY